MRGPGLIAIAVMAAVIVAAYFMYPRGIVPEENGRQQPVVMLTEDGFEPDELTVRRGTVVRFSSSLGAQYWPASNLHPDHTIYPEFDPLRPLRPDETWEFVFDAPGTWRYHDHLRSYYTGVIYVE